MSLVDDVFQSLSSGLRFKKSTNGKAARSLKRKDRGIGVKADKAEGDVLDFFGSAPKKEKVDKPKVEETVNRLKKKGRFKEEETEEKDEFTGDANEFRKKLKIKVKGNAVPAPMTTFTESGFLRGGSTQHMKEMARLLKSNVESSQYTEPTPIQMQSIPAMLEGRDIIGCAPTGSGKTAAFLLPLIMKLIKSRADNKSKSKQLCSLILAPTRELAGQILREFERLSHGKHFRKCLLRKATVGNVEATFAGKDSSVGFDLMVSTPLRLVRMIQENAIDLNGVECLVLDEADKLFEMGFMEQIDEIINACPKSAQRAMFSATMLPQIEELARTVMIDPIEITVGTRNAGADTIDQKLVFVGQEQGKLVAMRQFMQTGELVPPTLVFVQSKERAQELHQELIYDGIKVDAMHAERTQAQRDDLIKRFRRGDIWVLICTDLMGRGIDFKGVNCVINYDFPKNAISYIHRIGRTGRANRRGKAITLFTLEDTERLRSIANVIKLSGCDVPDWMLKMKKQGSRQRQRLEKKSVKRESIRTFSKFDRANVAKKRNMIKQSKQKKEEQTSES
mmetsp:Transcript_44923/g.71726  ORF Transcript_44923/g.71726 Transcript_44923/m.71726 type:complete len:564 (+) Transcript_44923:134-1825(+)